MTWGVVPSEIFPYGLLYAALNFRIAMQMIAVIMMGLICGVLPIFIHGQFSPLSFCLSIFAFLNSLAVLFITQSLFGAEKFRSVMKAFLLFLLAFCFVQWTGVLSGFTELFQLLIARGNLEPLSDARGVTGLSSEPSRSAYETLTLLYAFFVAEALHKGKSLRHIIAMTAYGIVFLFFNMSLTGLAIFGLYLGALYVMTLRLRDHIIGFVIGLLGLFLIFQFDGLLAFGDRAQYLLEINSFSDLWSYLVQASFHRAPVMWYSLVYLYHHPFGVGFGNYEYAQALYQSGELLYYNRLPLGMHLMLETGLLFSAISLLLIVYYFMKKHILLLVAPILFVVMFVSDPGNPIPLLAISYIICVKRNTPNK